MPIDISNVMLWNTEKNQPDRVSFNTDKDGNKIRVFRSSGKAVDL